LKLKQQNIEVDFKHSQNSIFIHANKGQIQQSVLNLIINSSQAMPRGGKISIRNSIENRNGKDMGCIYVKDNGTGIAEEMRDKIFDSFLTSKVEGNGLGLSIVRRILKDHDGDVKLIDSSSEGTTFKIFVPISEKDS
jgi:signal transduction histidine kinase